MTRKRHHDWALDACVCGAQRKRVKQRSASITKHRDSMTIKSEVKMVWIFKVGERTRADDGTWSSKRPPCTRVTTSRKFRAAARAEAVVTP